MSSFAITRETYYGALWTLLRGIDASPVIRLFDRRLRAVERLPDAELPALFMIVGKQDTVWKGKLPQHKLTAEIVLACANPDPHTAADIVMNALVDAVEAALDPGPGLEWETLGGLVSQCRIEGEAEFFPGPNSTRAYAALTIAMMIP